MVLNDNIWDCAEDDRTVMQVAFWSRGILDFAQEIALQARGGRSNMTNYKKLYEDMLKIVSLYQDEIVPKYRELTERLEKAVFGGRDEIDVVIDEGAFLPVRAHEEDGGFDLFAPVGKMVPAGGSAEFDTGVHMAIPKGYVGFLKSKSGLNVKHNLTGEGVIDAGYMGSICVKLYNNGDKDYEFKRGDKIIQIVLLPIITPKLRQTDTLEETERGANGFGSTGR